MTPAVARPLPQPRGEERRYFSDLREHQLPFYRCGACSRVFARPRERCAECGETPVEREWSAGRGVVHSFTTLHRAGHPWFADGVPYTIALVDFDEGFRGLADLKVSPYAPDPQIGDPVRVEFEDVNDDISLVHFVSEAT